jgi:hypothetical protein
VSSSVPLSPRNLLLGNPYKVVKALICDVTLGESSQKRQLARALVLLALAHGKHSFPRKDFRREDQFLQIWDSSQYLMPSLAITETNGLIGVS